MSKKMYKVKRNGWICGVCAGVAEYFDIDVSLVRIAWAVATFMWIGLLLYFVAAIILPEKPEFTDL